MYKVLLLFMTVLVTLPEPPVAGADQPPAKPDPKAPWSEAVEGLQCWLQADKTVWKVGEVPTFRLHVRNQGKRDLEIHMAQAACKLEFDGAWLDWTGPVSILSGTWPAGRHYDDFEVRVALETSWASRYKPIDLKPGKHKLRVAYVTLDRKQPVRVVSNAVEIQIKAPQNDKGTEDRNEQSIKAEVKGTLRFESGRGYFIAVKPANKAEKELRVWLWISENKVLVRQLQGLDGKEVIAKGKLGQLPEGVQTSVPPLGMYMSSFEIAEVSAR